MTEHRLPAWVEVKHLAYAAGFIDADGTITINGAIRQDRGDRMYLRAYIGGFGVEREPLDLLKAMFGGSVQVHREPGPKKADRLKSNFTLYAWHGQQGVARFACAYLLPYLMIKKRQAELVLQLGETRRKQGEGYNFYRMGDEETERRMAIRDQIRFLNKKGHLDYAS